MSSLGDYLHKQYGGDVPINPEQVAREAIQRWGSGRAAARELGVDEKTIRRWKSGETMRSEHADRYSRQAREQLAERKPGAVEVTFKYSGRTRTLKFGEGGKRLRAGAAEAIKSAYVSGDKEGMAKALISGIDDAWYSRELKRAYVAEMQGAPGTAGEDSGSTGAFPG